MSRRIILRILPFALLLGAAIFGLFLVGAATLSRPSPDAPLVISATPLENTLPGTASAPTALSEGTELTLPAANPPTTRTAARNPADRGNVTELLAATIAEQILSKNGGDPNALLDGGAASILETLPPEELLEQALNAAAITSPAELFEATVGTASLHADPAPTPESIASYLRTIANITKRHTPPENLINPANLSFADFLKLKAVTDGLTAELMPVVVPKPFLKWHADYLGLVLTQQNAFAALGNAAADPMKGIWALQTLIALEERQRMLQSDFELVSQRALPRTIN